MKKFKTNTVLQQSAKVFDDESAAPEEIAVAGEKALVEMYNGKKNESLNALRKRKYCEKVAKSLQSQGKMPSPYHSGFKISQLQSVSTNLSMEKSSLQFAGRIMGLEAH